MVDSCVSIWKPIAQLKRAGGTFLVLMKRFICIMFALIYCMFRKYFKLYLSKYLIRNYKQIKPTPIIIILIISLV